jgi:hypothetical protein
MTTIDNCKIMSAFLSFPQFVSGNPVLISGFRVKHGMTSQTAQLEFFVNFGKAL